MQESAQYIDIVILHDEFMLTKLVLSVNDMKFHKTIYSFSLFQQLPYFEQSNRKSYMLEAFENACDYNQNTLYLLFDTKHKVASVFSLDVEFGQR